MGVWCNTWYDIIWTFLEIVLMEILCKNGFGGKEDWLARMAAGQKGTEMNCYICANWWPSQQTHFGNEMGNLSSLTYDYIKIPMPIQKKDF